MRGGYQMVDFHNIPLSENPVTVPGVYEAIEGNYGKPLLFTNINITGGSFPTENFAFYSEPYNRGGDFIIPFAGLARHIRVTSADAVTTSSTSPASLNSLEV